MAKIPEEKRRAVAEAIFALEPYMNAALEGDMLPDYEIIVEWFDGEDHSVLLNLGTGQVLAGGGRGFFWEVGQEENVG
tara:strand:- start:994 stop:1227 length:234 start_codon:yes stop_codon:yes gene_type:complete